MSQMTSQELSIAPEDTDRAVLYGFVGRLLQAAPTDAEIVAIRALAADDTPVGQAIGRLAEAARAESTESLRRAYHDLFIGLGRGEFVPYASYYLTGFLHEKPLADLRASMAALGIERAEGVSEPEDHIAALMQMMEGLILGEFGEPSTLSEQKAFFQGHIGSWAAHFFKDLAATQTNAFYAAVGVLGGVLVEVEEEAFGMAQ
ncbi:TorD/DmsD family molecular chaperone [Roseibium aggregatum]|uniref:Molecular chaperone TorD family protein n=1 Tax=Roseibium aggregatum TaxID=187304 RepID=A0A926NZN3_9HYPH|nr:molecular chaperone TorD family protein [Roseibium aggregatum]MBD1546708.1 molecular chaperone TorD family protein [Roseibium aggregatum]